MAYSVAEYHDGSYYSYELNARLFGEDGVSSYLYSNPLSFSQLHHPHVSSNTITVYAKTSIPQRHPLYLQQQFAPQLDLLQLLLLLRGNQPLLPRRATDRHRARHRAKVHPPGGGQRGRDSLVCAVCPETSTKAALPLSGCSKRSVRYYGSDSHCCSLDLTQFV
jgi:hypothetical protein